MDKLHQSTDRFIASGVDDDLSSSVKWIEVLIKIIFVFASLAGGRCPQFHRIDGNFQEYYTDSQCNGDRQTSDQDKPRPPSADYKKGANYMNIPLISF